MRIAFVYPATDYDKQFHAEALPIGLLYLTAVAERRHGATVDIFDSRHGPALPPRRRLNDYDLMGFTAMSMQAPTALRLARKARDEGFRGPILFGGPHASVAPEHLKAQPFIDAVFIGEAEDTFLAYLRHLDGQPADLGRVWIRQPDGAWRFHPSDRFIENLDDLPLPAREKYGALARRIRAINMTTTRGCPFQCNYCQPTKEILFGRRVRRRSVENVAAEIEDAIERFGIRSFSIDDDTFTFHQRTVLEFCERIKPLGLTWSCQSRSDIRRETLQTMKDSGLTMLYVGAESGSQRVLDWMNKSNTVEKNTAFLDMCCDLGVDTWCNMMVGYPGETEDDMKKSLDFVRRTNPTRVCVFQATPFPGTRLWESNAADVIARDWDQTARHVRVPKFRSMAPLQRIVLYYTTLIAKEWGRPLNADLLQLSGLSERICRRFPWALKYYMRRARWFTRRLNQVLEIARSGDLETAVSRLEDLKRRNPRRSEPLGHLAWIYLNTDRPAQAAENYAAFLRLTPHDAHAHCLYAKSLLQAGDAQRARSEFEEALRLDPDLAEARQTLDALDGATSRSAAPRPGETARQPCGDASACGISRTSLSSEGRERCP